MFRLCYTAGMVQQPSQSSANVSNMAARTRWTVFLHWYVLTALGISGLFSIYIVEGFSERFWTNTGLISVMLLSNFIFYFLAKAKDKGRLYYRNIVLSIIIYELLFITFAMYINGGLESQVFTLYVVPILLAIVTLRGLWVYLTALTSVILIGGFLWADYEGWITSLAKLTSLSKNAEYVINTTVFICLVILLITYLATYIVKLLRQRERQAIANAEALARAQEVARIGSWEWDVATSVISWSDQMYKLFGFRADKPVSYKMLLDKVHPDDRAELAKKIDQSLKAGKPFQVTHRAIPRANKILTIQSEGQIVRSPEGEFVKLVGTARDVTAEHELEQAKSNFVSLASHQLRTPATEVKMLLAILKDGFAGELKADQQELLAKAYDTNERQIKIANDLLGIAQLNSGKMNLQKTSLELGSWLAGIIQEIRPMLDDKKQLLVFKQLQKPVTVKADTDQLRLVVENLIENASKYTPAKGTITVRYTSSNSYANVSIRDTGIGIAKKDQAHIFDIYNRGNSANNLVGGSGLGLYLVKRIVDLHRGKVTVTSRPGSGSTFTIQLPYR